MLLQIVVESKQNHSCISDYPIREISLVLEVNIEDDSAMLPALVISRLLAQSGLTGAVINNAVASELSRLIQRAWNEPYFLQKETTDSYTCSCRFYDAPDCNVAFDNCEFEIQITHPSKIIPWKSTGTGTIYSVPEKIKMMLMTSTKLQEDASLFTSLCQDFVNAVDSFEVAAYADMSYDRTVNDYRIQFTLTKIKESQ